MKVTTANIRLRCGHVSEYAAPLPVEDDIVFCRGCDGYQVVITVEGFVQYVREAQQSTCRKGGHPWTMINTYINPGSGKRACRICKRNRERKTRRDRTL